MVSLLLASSGDLDDVEALAQLLLRRVDAVVAVERHPFDDDPVRRRPRPRIAHRRARPRRPAASATAATPAAPQSAPASRGCIRSRIWMSGPRSRSRYGPCAPGSPG